MKEDQRISRECRNHGGPCHTKPHAGCHVELHQALYTHVYRFRDLHSQGRRSKMPLRKLQEKIARTLKVVCSLVELSPARCPTHNAFEDALEGFADHLGRVKEQIIQVCIALAVILRDFGQIARRVGRIFVATGGTLEVQLVVSVARSPSIAQRLRDLCGDGLGALRMSCESR